MNTLSPVRIIAAIVALPVVATFVIPLFIWFGFGPDSIANETSETLRLATMGFAAILLVIGLALFISTVRLFAFIGKGSLAPWDPPITLVVVGPYQYVRNPMIAGVMFCLAAESLFFLSPALFLWFLIFTTINAVYIPSSEEPGLLARFGEPYKEYCRHVPRWIPRWTAWKS